MIKAYLIMIVTFPYKIKFMRYKDADDLADIHHLKYLIDQIYKSKELALQLYQDLYNKIPRYKYIDRIKFLSEE